MPVEEWDGSLVSGSFVASAGSSSGWDNLARDNRIIWNRDKRTWFRWEIFSSRYLDTNERQEMLDYCADNFGEGVALSDLAWTQFLPALKPWYYMGDYRPVIRDGDVTITGIGPKVLFQFKKEQDMLMFILRFTK